MAFKQLRTILALETQTTDAGTKVVKLPLSNFLHHLVVYGEAKLGAGPLTKAWSMYDHITKIEVIANGSEVLFSLTPRQIHDLERFVYDIAPEHVESNTAGAVVSSYFHVPFGAVKWDPSYYLPLAKFADLELRISYSPTIAADGFASGTTKFAVFGYVTMAGEPGPFAGFLRHTTIYDWSTGASGDVVIDLPRRIPIAAIQIYAKHATAALKDILTNIKLSLNGDQIIPLNIPTSFLIPQVKGQVAEVDSVHICLAEYENGKPLDPTKYDMVQLVLTQGTSGADAKVALQEILRV